jgi:ubiquinone/menaquinone biosynthesis C-methylase UbiE
MFDAVNSLVNTWGMGIEDQLPDKWFDEINKPTLKILEVGFGKGSLLKRLSNENGPELYGVDCAQVNFRHASNELYVNAALSLADISRERLQYPDGHFDVVIMMEVLEHVLSPLHVVLEIQRVLKKDGLFLFSWPEETLISGIGREKDQTKRNYGNGYHSFPYPGLFQYDNMRVFFNQTYFEITEELKNDYHIFFRMINRKLNKPHILDVVNGDYDSNDLYGSLKTPPTISLDS